MCTAALTKSQQSFLFILMYMISTVGSKSASNQYTQVQIVLFVSTSQNLCLSHIKFRQNQIYW